MFLVPSPGRYFCSTCLDYIYHKCSKEEIGPKDYSSGYRIKWLMRFAADSDRGLGDTVERLLDKAGGRSLKRFKAMLESYSINCGCTNRRDWLNRQFPYDNLKR